MPEGSWVFFGGALGSGLGFSARVQGCSSKLSHSISQKPLEIPYIGPENGIWEFGFQLRVVVFAGSMCGPLGAFHLRPET